MLSADDGRSEAWLAPARWTGADIARIEAARHPTAPVIARDDVVRVSPELDIWDAWPVQDDDGMPSRIAAGETLWMALGAPRFDDPDERHGHARIHLLRHQHGRWADLGPAMPDGFSPGSREWSGSAVLDADRVTLTLYFTAAGRRGEAQTSFEQRLFSARARLDLEGGTPALRDWRDLTEIVARDPRDYMASDAGTGSIGSIKAFRDPGYFRDPADGRRVLLFAGSRAGAESAFNGVIGRIDGNANGAPDWRLLPPIVDATDVNNELERPHIVLHEARYYLFWSTQRHVFAPAHAAAPTGLYGMIADSLAGGWRPLNGSGLVFANPAAAPRQAYSWLVLPDLSVISFVDDWGRGVDDAGERRFGATFAPVLHLRLDGDSATLAAP